VFITSGSPPLAPAPAHGQQAAPRHALARLSVSATLKPSFCPSPPPSRAARRALVAKGVSGIAVVGRRGDLTGHLSATDARCLGPGVFSQLLLPVREFLAMHAQRAPRGSGGGAGGAPAERAAAPGALPLDGRVLCAQPTSALGALVAALVRQRVHRVYITDSDTIPVGIVTCTDLLALLDELCARGGGGSRTAPVAGAEPVPAAAAVGA
jgi:CBS domain-containing protein